MPAWYVLQTTTPASKLEFYGRDKMGLFKNLARNFTGTVLEQKSHQTAEGISFDFSLKQRDEDKYILLTCSAPGASQSFTLENSDAEHIANTLQNFCTKL